MMNRWLWAVAIALTVATMPASADPISYTWVSDPVGDASGGSTWETYGIGYALSGSRLYFAVRENLPKAGAYGRDSYAYTRLNPGDLYLNVDGSLESGTGAVFGIGLTTHQNVVTQAYSGSWAQVTEGNLYTGAVFADGTYERNDRWLYNQGKTPTPPDADNSMYNNSHPTLIRAYTDELTGVSDVSWNSVSGQPWKYQIEGWVDLAAFGANQPTSHVELRWAPECGNDAARAVVPIPEPGTFLTLGAVGCAAALGRLRRRRRRTSEAEQA